MDAPSLEDRAKWLDQLGSDETHQRLVAQMPCLRHVDERVAGMPAPLTGWVRVGAWNVLRGHHPEALAGTLASAGIQLGLLSEVDDGMARTDNVDTIDAIAGVLGFASAFGVEFVELGLGDEAEQEMASGRSNTRGLHGNAIVSASSLERPVVVRLPDAGAGWFAADSAQPRVGGRMAVVATVDFDGVPVQVASTHLENRTTADHRAEQLEVLLRTIDERDASGPAIVGGDFNTVGADVDVLLDRAAVRALREDEAWRFTWPVVYEPLFEVARGHGFAWTDANVAAPTMDHAWAGLPDLVPMRLDWLLVRGLVARRPAVVPDGPALGPSLGHRGRAPAMTIVRVAVRPEDEEGILAVVAAAFSNRNRDASEELGIVRATWAAQDANQLQLVELVADDESTVVGHVLAAPGRIDGFPTSAAGVAPVCVAPSHQRRGIGAALVQSLVDAATARAWPLLVLLGDPAYYARFGFEPAGTLGLDYAPAGAGSPHFQARRLQDYDARLRGTFTYCWE